RRRPARAGDEPSGGLLGLGRNATFEGILDRVDPRQIEELRRWGQRLAQDDSHPELKPAGRAILMLIAENEQLRAPHDEPPSDDGYADDDQAPPAYESRARRLLEG